MRSHGSVLPLRIHHFGFGSDYVLPDYPKYSIWSNSYVLTSCDFGPTTEYGISVYALEKSKMIVGDPTLARYISS